MNKFRAHILFVFLATASTLTAQEDNIPKFLDSLKQQEICFVEVKKGYDEKANELLREIDTRTPDYAKNKADSK